LIETFFLNCIEEVELTKSSRDIRDILSRITEQKEQDDFQISDSIYGDFDNPFFRTISKNYFQNIYLIGKNGDIFPIKKGPNSIDKSSARNYQLLWEQTVNFDAPVLIQDYDQLNADASAYLTMSSKILDDNKLPIGVVVFEIVSSSIDSIMLNYQASNGLGASGESYLVGEDYLMRSSSRFQKNSILKTEVKTEAVESAYANQSGTRLITDYRNISVLSSYSKISVPQLNWVMITEIDYKEVTIPIYKIRNEIIFISIFIFLIVLIVIAVLSRRITYPIQKLNQAAHEVGIGNLDVVVANKSDDEIGELTDTFNAMVSKLKDQSAELEQARINSLKSLINGQETERQRLSRELHDSLGQLLIGLKLKYESCLLDHSAPNSKIENLGVLFDQTIEETRRISNNLMPAALSEFGLRTAVRNICNEISEVSDIDVQLITEGTGRDINIELKIYLFRIIQEALTNIVKHSQAKQAVVEMHFEEQHVFVEISDNGKGFEYKKIKEGISNGLNNIKDRVSLLSGELKINSVLSEGTSINIKLPL
jgi:signal transduction histidine kinase